MSGEMILYNTEDGVTVVQLRERDGSVWLSQAQIAELFEATKQNVSLHIRNILEVGELGRVDKRDSQTGLVLIQECFLGSSHGSRGLVGRGV
ncbi:hypothetical protein J2W40_002114 [Sphingobium xenophagum]|uniref:DNA-binding protein n=1 Tax=Sphingobium xenophagum TaxID=121428 RepID=A0ABU1X144_SPHXE|nr:hypothetical protein [Sphingobium xenophagum]